MKIIVRHMPEPAGDLPAPARLAFRAQMSQTARVNRTGNESAEERTETTLEALRAPLVGYFRKRVHQQDDVPDLVQEVFLRLTTRGGLQDIDNLTGYVFQIAASVLTDRQRRRIVRHQDLHVELDPERMGEPEIGPDRIVAGRQALQAAIAALDRLPERTRTIFVLRRLEGMRYLDIAKRLGLSVSAVEKHMVRAVEHLATIGPLR